MVQTPAYRYANATNDEIRTWLRERELPFVEEIVGVPGVRLPGRLTGPLHGVTIHGAGSTRNAPSLFDVIDGRLALALDDFCAHLSEAGIVELVHYTIYRPPTAVNGDGAGLTRHPGALAIDVGELRYGNGRRLRVKSDWSPYIGAKTCGPGQRLLGTEAGETLRDWVCQARRLGIFHYALTPHFDAAHADHLHLEIKPGVKWFLYN
ncbi:MAG: extensin family protein [Polyangiaceae bacterium]